jgi:hypothetical protein
MADDSLRQQDVGSQRRTQFDEAIFLANCSASTVLRYVWHGGNSLCEFSGGCFAVLSACLNRPIRQRRNMLPFNIGCHIDVSQRRAHVLA